MLASGSRHGEAVGAALGGLGMVAFYGLTMLFSLAMLVYLPAALAQAALRGTVAAGFDWRAALAFIRANLGNYLLSLVDLPGRQPGLPARHPALLRGHLPGGVLGLSRARRRPRPGDPVRPVTSPTAARRPAAAYSRSATVRCAAAERAVSCSVASAPQPGPCRGRSPSV